MALDQVENPPEHAHHSPAGEIRGESRPVLRTFTAVIVLAMALPVIGVIIGGLLEGHWEYGLAGGVIVAILLIVFGFVLWPIISSRTNVVRRPNAARH